MSDLINAELIYLKQILQDANIPYDFQNRCTLNAAVTNFFTLKTTTTSATIFHNLSCLMFELADSKIKQAQVVFLPTIWIGSINRYISPIKIYYWDVKGRVIEHHSYETPDMVPEYLLKSLVATKYSVVYTPTNEQVDLKLKT